jgi:hypothetical protein
MKRKRGVALLLACTAGVVAVGTAAATSPKPAKKPVFDMKYDCAKVAPGALLTTLAGGYGGTYAVKPRTKIDTTQGARQSGGYSHCDYSQSAGYPWGARAEGPGEVTIVYGARAVAYFKSDHAAAVEGVKCTNLKAQNPNITPDPRQCGPVAITGFGPNAYEAASSIAVLRGKVFLQVALSSPPDANGQPQMVSADLLMSIEKALLARMPAM